MDKVLNSVPKTKESVVDKVRAAVALCPFCRSYPDVWVGPGRCWVNIQCSNKDCVRPYTVGFWKHALKRWNRRSC